MCLYIAEKPTATKADSHPYIDTTSANTGQNDVTGDAEDPTYDVIDENYYASLRVRPYENMATDHDYTTPVFRRGESQMSNESAAYMDMGAT